MHQSKIKGFITRAWLRIYTQRVLDGLTTGLIGSLAIWMVLLVLYKTAWIPMEVVTTYGLMALVFPALGLVWAFARRTDPREIAMKLDEVNRLHARLTTAYCFLDIPEGERTAFQKAAIAEAEGHIGKVRISEATPFRIPRDAMAVVLVALALAAIVIVKPPVIHGTLVPEEAPPAPEAALDDEDLKIAKEKWEKTKEELEKSEDPQAKQLLVDMDKLFEQLEMEELSKEDFIKRVDEISKKFFEDREDDWRHVLDELKDSEDELAKNKHTEDLAKALKEGDMDKAAKELEKLAEKLEKGEIKDRDIEDLAKKLEKFAKKMSREEDKLNELAKKKEEELNRLKKKLEKNKDKLSDDQKKRLSRLERELKKLTRNRDNFKKSSRGRSLKKLERASKEGASRMRESKSRGKGATRDKNARAEARKKFGQSMKMGANEMRDLDKKSKTGRAMDKTQAQLGDMKDMARRGGKTTEQKSASMKDFNQRATGQKPGEQKPGQQGQQGQQPGQQPGQLGDMQKGQQPGQQGEGQKPGQGQGQKGEGQGQGQKGEGQGKASQGKGQGQKDSQGQGQGEGQGQGQAKGTNPDQKGQNAENEGKGRGTGSGGKLLGDATNINDAKFKNTKVKGRDAGGPTQSQVIEAAASKGFATTEYKDVYVEYENLAEEVMEKDQIPPGYRYYVRRYFDLIRPRDSE